MTAIPMGERLARVETKLEALEKAIADVQRTAEQGFARIERHVGGTLEDHEDRITEVEKRTDRILWLSAVIVAAIALAVALLTVAEKLHWIPT